MLINGSLVARFRAVIDAIIALSGIESAVISLLLLVLSALFELIAGIVGWRTGGGHAKPKTCRWLALIILVPSAINFLNSFSASGISWTALGGIVLPLVYFFAANNL